MDQDVVGGAGMLLNVRKLEYLSYSKSTPCPYIQQLTIHTVKPNTQTYRHKHQCTLHLGFGDGLDCTEKFCVCNIEFMDSLLLLCENVIFMTIQDNPIPKYQYLLFNSQDKWIQDFQSLKKD